MANNLLATTRESLSGYLDLLQQVLIVTRYLVGEKNEHRALYQILDQIEILPSLLIDPNEEHLSLFVATVVGLEKLHEMFTGVATQARNLTR